MEFGLLERSAWQNEDPTASKHMIRNTLSKQSSESQKISRPNSLEVKADFYSVIVRVLWTIGTPHHLSTDDE